MTDPATIGDLADRFMLPREGPADALSGDDDPSGRPADENDSGGNVAQASAVPQFGRPYVPPKTGFTLIAPNGYERWTIGCVGAVQWHEGKRITPRFCGAEPEKVFTLYYDDKGRPTKLPSNWSPQCTRCRERERESYAEHRARSMAPDAGPQRSARKGMEGR